VSSARGSASDKATTPPAAKFTRGSTLRHVVVMTATGSIGLMAIFLVDFLNLFYISRLGEQDLAAAIGYAGTFLFFMTSVCIGITIAGTALVSRAIGARQRRDSRRLATSSLVFMTAAGALLAIAALPLLGRILTMLGATGRTFDIAWRFLAIVTPSTPILGLGMACSGVLRAVGDAKRSMYVTLAGGIVTAVLDPLLIFGFGLGVDGAAIVSVLSRVALAWVGLHGAIKVHDQLAVPTLAATLRDVRPLGAIAVPAVLANIATPIGNAFVTAAIAHYGDSAIAGYAVIGRISPLAFGAVFAMSGSIGPILGQNFGARRFDRVRRTVSETLALSFAYCVLMWGVLALAQDPIIRVFAATGEGAALIRFFCDYVAASFGFLGAAFVGNAIYNNLGFPTLSTVFNWSRATLGTIPFVWIGARYFGPEGVIAGQGGGAVVLGALSIVASYWVVGRLAERAGKEAAEIPLVAQPIAPFNTGKAATAIDWVDAEEGTAH
jgi:putative MATE family efflux protein